MFEDSVGQDLFDLVSGYAMLRDVLKVPVRIVRQVPYHPQEVHCLALPE
jgi:hypothetical protein